MRLLLGVLFIAGPGLAFQASDLDTTSSELRPLIERFSADRSLILRANNLPGSSIESARLKQFYT